MPASTKVYSLSESLVALGLTNELSHVSGCDNQFNFTKMAPNGAFFVIEQLI